MAFGPKALNCAKFVMAFGAKVTHCAKTMINFKKEIFHGQIRDKESRRYGCSLSITAPNTEIN